MLDSRDAQARHAAAVDRALPAGELLEAESVALARLDPGTQQLQVSLSMSFELQ